MHNKMILCFFVISAVFSQSFGYFSFDRNDGTSSVYGGKPFLKTVHQSVVNGKLDKKKMIEVVIEIPGADENQDDDLCGGTIIGDRFILTAAHCFVHRSFCHGVDEIKLKASITPAAKLGINIEGICHNYEDKKCAIGDQGKSIRANNIYILEEYYKKSNCTSGDLAIIELAEIIGDHGATLSDSLELPTSGDFMVSGFGEDPENDGDTGHMLKTVILKAEKCAENRGKYDSICTEEIDKDVCAGDSGGALVDKNDEKIVGVVSSGMRCNVLHQLVEDQKSENLPLIKGKGGIFTSTSKHYGFICDIVRSIQGCPKTLNKEPYLTIS